jgi:nucleoside recognition membrane protein YjiH
MEEIRNCFFGIIVVVFLILGGVLVLVTANTEMKEDAIRRNDVAQMDKIVKEDTGMIKAMEHSGDEEK